MMFSRDFWLCSVCRSDTFSESHTFKIANSSLFKKINTGDGNQGLDMLGKDLPLSCSHKFFRICCFL